MNARLIIRCLAATLGIFASFNFSAAQDSGALITALVRKGILSTQEAEEIRAEWITESDTVPAKAFAGGKHTGRLNIGMRMQMQYATLDTDVDGTAMAPAATNHAFLQRIYLTLKAGLGAAWGGRSWLVRSRTMASQ